MQFQVKGQDYFLEYIDQEKIWVVFTRTEDGIQRIPVYSDGQHSKRYLQKQDGTRKVQ